MPDITSFMTSRLSFNWASTDGGISDGEFSSPSNDSWGGGTFDNRKSIMPFSCTLSRLTVDIQINSNTADGATLTIHTSPALSVIVSASALFIQLDQQTGFVQELNLVTTVEEFGSWSLKYDQQDAGINMRGWSCQGSP